MNNTHAHEAENSFDDINAFLQDLTAKYGICHDCAADQLLDFAVMHFTVSGARNKGELLIDLDRSYDAWRIAAIESGDHVKH